jgi:two-component sensor histidine kinase
MFSVYTGFASYYLSVSDLKESISYYKLALAEANKVKVNSEYNRSLAMTNLAKVLVRDKQYEKAKIYIKKSLQISEKIQNPKQIDFNKKILIIILLAENKFEETIEIYNQIKNSENEVSDENLDLFKGTAYNGLNKYEEAFKVLSSMKEYISSSTDNEEKIDYYKQLAICNYALGNFRVAYDNMLKKNEIESKFLEDKGSMRTLGLQIKFELSQKNYAIQKLQLEKKIAKEKQLKQSATLNLLIGGSVLLVILIAVLVWAYQFRKRGNFIFGLSRIQLQNAIQEKEVLVKEIHHRVKNNFQLISSMMNIQAMDKSIDVEEFVKRTTSRIVSLSSIHEKLYLKDNLYQLDANEYVKEMASYVKSSFMDLPTVIDYQFSDDVVILDLETIMPLGLIINELLTNSYKYAFKGRAKGLIEISIKQVASGKYKLTYADNGVGINEGASFSKSIGMNLVDALSKQLGAQSKMSFDNGAHFEIVFKKND